MPENIETNKHYLTVFEICESLSVSVRTVSRYIKRGWLHPKKVIGPNNTRQYRFSEEDIENCRRLIQEELLDVSRQAPPRQDKNGPDMPGQALSDSEAKLSKPNNDDPLSENNDHKVKSPKLDKLDLDRQDKEIIELLKETTHILKDQLTIKDEQIKRKDQQIQELIQREKESNVLIGRMQEKIQIVEPSKFHPVIERLSDTPSQDIPTPIEKRFEENKKQPTVKRKVQKKVSAMPRQDKPQTQSDNIGHAKPKSKLKEEKKGFFRRLFLRK